MPDSEQKDRDIKDGSSVQVPASSSEVHAPPQIIKPLSPLGGSAPAEFAVDPSVLLTTQTSYRSGPLPSAEELGEYESVSPGAARWIFSEAEKASDHLRKLEIRGMQLAERDAVMRRVFPFAIVIAFLSASVLLALTSSLYGILGFAGTLAGVVIVYLKGPLHDDEGVHDDEDIRVDEEESGER